MTGFVSHKTMAKLEVTAPAPEIHGSHARLKARGFEMVLIDRGRRSAAIGGRAFAEGVAGPPAAAAAEGARLGLVPIGSRSGPKCGSVLCTA